MNLLVTRLNNYEDHIFTQGSPGRAVVQMVESSNDIIFNLILIFLSKLPILEPAFSHMEVLWPIARPDQYCRVVRPQMSYKISITTTTLTRNIRKKCKLMLSSKLHYISGQSGESPDGNTPNNSLSTGKRKERERESRSEPDFKTIQIGSKI